HLCQAASGKNSAALSASPMQASERLLAKLRYPQPYLASLGLQAALVVASAGIATRRAALIALRIAQPIGLGIEQGVQRFLHGPPHHPVEMALDPLIVNRDDIV